MLLVPPGKISVPLNLKHIETRRIGRYLSKGGISGHLWEQLVLPLHTANGVLFCPANLAPVISLWARRRVIATVHDVGFVHVPQSYTLAFRLLYRFIIPKVLKRASAVIAVSNAEAKILRESIKGTGSRLVVIANGGFPGDRIHKRTKGAEQQSPPLALYVGAINTKKNVQGLVAAARDLKDTDIRIRIVGEKANCFSAIEVDEAAISGANVEFTGRLSDEGDC